jgi:chromosomal replication initiation ATPase DnaA
VLKIRFYKLSPSLDKLNHFSKLQLSFDFPFQEKYLPEDFVVSTCNQIAFNFINNYDLQNNNLPKIFSLKAPKFAGKSYLANILKKKFSAEILNLKELENANLIKLIKAKRFYIIENVEKVQNQELLLQVFNLIQEKMAFLMITSTSDLGLIGTKIKDLNSRLKNVCQIEISKPDDNLIKMLLLKNFSAKQLKVEKKVIDFLTQNLNRDFASIFDAVRLLEFYSFEKKRKITIPLIKEVILDKKVRR